MKSYREILLFFGLFFLFCLFFTVIGISSPQVLNLKQEFAFSQAEQTLKQNPEPVIVKILAAVLAISELAPFLSTKAKGVMHGFYLVLKHLRQKKS